MSANDRFFECETLGFPEVSNYDYQDNVYIRSLNNLIFRWEDVAVQSVYLMQESTVNGSFETNTAVADLSITNQTGINFLTTYTSTLPDTYTGWTATGAATLYIGPSGLFVSSGQLPGVTSSFQAHPIIGDYSIGLYCSGNAQYPALISDQMAIGVEGPIILETTHQLYLKAKLNYGSSGRVKPLVRGWNGGSIVAYYDPYSGVWTASEPDVYYSLASTGYTTVKYLFGTSSFPGSTPTSFDMYVKNDLSGTFVTVDDLHIDILMKKNAFLDYIVPTGYMIQITPDLGWHDMLSMFDSNVEASNPHLTTIGPFALELGNLVDNLDNSVTATLDQIQLDQATSDNFKKYLWRALPITPNGEVGAGGLPAKFEYVGNLIDSYFTVDSVIDSDSTSVKTILGKKSSSMSIVIDNISSFPGLEYPTPTTWKLSISISEASRTLKIKAIDASGTESSLRYVTLTNKVYEQNTKALWNVFDEHGLVADVARLDNESNYDYAIRIRDAFQNRSTPDFIGIVNGATRELNLNKVTNAISISIDKNAYKTSKVKNILVEGTAHSVRIHDPSFVITERLYVDPIYKTVDLTYLPKDKPVVIKADTAEPIPSTNVDIIYNQDKTTIKYRLYLDTKSTYVEVTYPYYEEILYKNNKNIGDVITKINSIKTVGGVKIATAVLSPLLSGGESSLGLYSTSFSVTPDQPGTIGWSSVILRRMTDIGFRDYFLDEDTYSVKNTEYYSYVKELKNNTKVFLGAVEADRDRWDAADYKSLSMESIPTLFDPPLSKIVSLLSDTGIQFEPIEAWGRNFIGYGFEYLQNAGLTSNLFQPGVAHTNDLKPDVYVTTSYNNIINTLEENIGPAKNNNNVIIFSGNR